MVRGKGGRKNKNQGKLHSQIPRSQIPASLPSWNSGSGNLGMQLFHGRIPAGNEAGSMDGAQGGEVDSRLEYPEFWEQSQNPGMLWAGRDLFLPFQHPRLLRPGLEHSRDGEVPREFPKFLWELCQGLNWKNLFDLILNGFKNPFDPILMDSLPDPR